MDKEDNFLQFEEDDASKTSMNGKQVFLAKRINGKTTHNKQVEEQSNRNFKEEFEENDDLFVEFSTPQAQDVETKPKSPKKQNSKNPQKKNGSSNKNKKNNKKKKKKKVSKWIKIVLLLLIIAGCIVFAMVSPIFNIKFIEVEGNDKIKSDTIISLSQIKEDENLFRINKGSIANKIKENPYIGSVSIKRELPSKIRIIVEEREIAYQIKVVDSFVCINYEGYILEKSAQKKGIPVVEGLKTNKETLLNSKRLSNDDIGSLNGMYKIMSSAKVNDIAKLITKIIIKDEEYILELEDEDKTVYIGDENNLNKKMSYLKSILDEEEDNEGIIFLNVDFNNGENPYFREKVEQEDDEENEGEED